MKTPRSKEYRVTIYDPTEKSGHCTCPDFATNHLDTCKHLIFAYKEFSSDKDFASRVEKETFPCIHITWNSRLHKPCCYYEQIDDPANRWKSTARPEKL